MTPPLLTHCVRKKLSRHDAQSMEGLLTLKEMKEALFIHMKGSSSPGVNNLRAIWSDMEQLEMH